MINHFTFNGTSTAQLGLIVSGVSIFGAGSRKVEKAGIPGRNGDLQIELGGFNNYTVRYTVSITNDFTTTAQQIREWLLESKGYCELTDTYHPDEIRKACFNSDIEFTTSMLYKYGQASIQFDCLPERYLTTNTPITTTATEDTTTGATMSLNTVSTPIKITLNGNTTQEGTPTPSTPQAIHNVSGDNTINVASFNIWDEVSVVASSRIQSRNYIPVLPNTAYYRKSPNNILVTYYNANKEQLSTGTWGTGLFTTPQNCYFIKFMVDPAYGTTYKHDICINVSNAEKNGTYEPYTRQSYPLNLGSIELNKIGSYQDYIYKNGGKWYVHKEIQKIVPPAHGYNYSTGTSSNVRYFTLNPANSAIGGSTSINTDANYYGFSNRFICRTGVEIGHFYITNSGNGLLFVVDQAITTSAELQTWLESNPTEFIILMRTATNTEITDTTLINQLNNIEKAYSYNGTTNILQVNNDNGFMLGVVSLHGSTFNSNYKGEPIITVNSTGLIYLNGEVMEVLSAPVTINCQTMQCYNGVVNMNNEVRVNDFPEIKIGANEVGSSMTLTITPNNWRH